MSDLDLDAIEARALASASIVGFASIHGAVSREDVPALVAEVRRLRKVVESLEGFPFTESRKWGTR